jgi:two-component system, probable response regulator PhcQ
MENVVLLVDDDQNILHGLVRALRHQPYQLYTATSGEEALIVLKGHRVDVIVSDEHMPGMCGGELLAWVADNYPEVVRIVLTGRPTVETLIRAINEGAVYQFFTKPCDAVLLGVAIRKAMEHKALLTENRRLLNINDHQMRELERFRQNLELLTAVVSRDIQEPLQTVAIGCRALAEQYRDIFDPKTTSLAESALDGIGEVQRLVNGLLEHWCSKGPKSANTQYSSGKAPTRPSAQALSPCLAIAPSPRDDAAR